MDVTLKGQNVTCYDRAIGRPINAGRFVDKTFIKTVNYLHQKDSPKGYFKAGDYQHFSYRKAGYGIQTVVFNKLEEWGCQMVHIRENDTGLTWAIAYNEIDRTNHGDFGHGDQTFIYIKEPGIKILGKTIKAKDEVVKERMERIEGSAGPKAKQEKVDWGKYIRENEQKRKEQEEKELGGQKKLF